MKHTAYLLLLVAAQWVLQLKICAATSRPAANIEQALDATVLVESVDRDGRVIGHGSGFFVGGRGIVVTNSHVIEGAHRVRVRTRLGDRFEFDSVMFVVPCRDFAGFHLPNVAAYHLELRTDARQGERVYALGHPLGERWQVLEGMVEMEHELLHQVHQTITAAIRPGSSGGPVVDEAMKVVGQAQYLLYTFVPQLHNGELVRTRVQRVHRAKKLEFLGDHRWVFLNRSLDDTTVLIQDFQNFSEIIEALELLSHGLLISWDVIANSGFQRVQKTNPRHLDVGGNPLVISDVIVVDTVTLARLERLLSSFLTVLRSRETRFQARELYQFEYRLQMIFERMLVSVGQMRRADQMNYTAGYSLFSQARHSFNDSKNLFRDLMFLARDLLNEYGPPDFHSDSQTEGLQNLERLFHSMTGANLLPDAR